MICYFACKTMLDQDEDHYITRYFYFDEDMHCVDYIIDEDFFGSGGTDIEELTRGLIKVNYEDVKHLIP